MEPNNPINELQEAPVSLKEIYPMPRRSIRDAVMAQIAEERAAETKKAETKILTFREKIAKNRKTIARIGSMAACGVFLLGALAVAGPLMNKTSDSAEQIRGRQFSEVREADAEAEFEDVYYSLTDSVCDDADNMAEASLYAAGAATECAQEQSDPAPEDAINECATYAETAVPADTEAPMYAAVAPTNKTTEAAVPEEAGMADPIKTLVIEFLDSAEYSAWMTANAYTDPAAWSLSELINAFGITRTELADILGDFAAEVDMDALYFTAEEETISEN